MHAMRRQVPARRAAAPRAWEQHVQLVRGLRQDGALEPEVAAGRHLQHGPLARALAVHAQRAQRLERRQVPALARLRRCMVRHRVPAPQETEAHTVK
jgi:hypothetical protein